MHGAPEIVNLHLESGAQLPRLAAGEKRETRKYIVTSPNWMHVAEKLTIPSIKANPTGPLTSCMLKFFQNNGCHYSLD
jgi:hypothetical protein